MAKNKKVRAKKPPSIMRQVLTVFYERALTHLSLLIASRLEWSVEFLTAMLVKAAKMNGGPMEMDIVSPSGAKITIRSTQAMDGGRYRDDSIFNHLDDEIRVRQFIDTVNRGS